MTARSYRVLEKRDAVGDLIAIAAHIEHWTDDPDAADRAVDNIRAFIRSLGRAPHRGTRRDDLRPGLRIVPFKRAAIAIEIDDAARIVHVLRVFYGGQDYEAVFLRERG